MRVKRWSLEVTYEESRAQLGVETQRQWSDLAIERSTPCLLGLYSLVVLLGHALHPDGQIPVQQAAWYRKTQATERRCPDYRASASVGRIDFSDIAFSPRSLFSATYGVDPAPASRLFLTEKCTKSSFSPRSLFSATYGVDPAPASRLFLTEKC